MNGSIIFPTQYGQFGQYSSGIKVYLSEITNLLVSSPDGTAGSVGATVMYNGSTLVMSSTIQYAASDLASAQRISDKIQSLINTGYGGVYYVVDLPTPQVSSFTNETTYLDIAITVSGSPFYQPFYVRVDDGTIFAVDAQYTTTTNVQTVPNDAYDYSGVTTVTLLDANYNVISSGT